VPRPTVSPKRTNVRDLAKRQFGLLTVIEEDDARASNGAILWVCECQCGARVKVMGSNLLKAEGSGSETRSCGCLKGSKGGRASKRRAARKRREAARLSTK
jgi:hypothetical protein